MKPVNNQLFFKYTTINDPFWNSRLKVNTEEAIYHQWNQLEKTNCIDNFRILIRKKTGFREGFFFSDSDAYKWLDAACRIQATTPMDKLKAIIDEFILLIQKAQDDDGYLYTYNQIFFPDTRWKNLWIEHELYCLGHLIEAAISHHGINGSRDFLSCAEKAANLLVNVFSRAKSKHIPGHQEIEIALIKLYRLTDNDKYLDLAGQFLNRRGKTRFIWWEFLKNKISTDRRAAKVMKMREKYLAVHAKDENSKEIEQESTVDGTISSALEAAKYELPPGMKRRFFLNSASGKYNQNHLPIKKQMTPEGHSVRFAYMETAAAMYTLETGSQEFLNALETVWDHMVQKRMFVTGGIGSLPMIEGFGFDYELDPEHAYCETCAALGSMFWNWEMTLLTKEAKYADLFEWQLYNASSVGMALDGKAYFYRNPLVSADLTRKTWYTVPCCPSNLSRTWAALGGYIYSYEDSNMWIHQYLGNKTRVPLTNPLTVKMESGFPWNGQVQIRMKLNSPEEFVLNLRIPSWVDDYSIKINGKEQEITKPAHGGKQKTASGYSPYSSHYLPVKREWKTGDTIELEFPMEIRVLHLHPEVKATRGKAAITRGPIVYCLESNDNPGIDIFGAKIDITALKAEFSNEHFNGVWIIKGKTSDGSEFLAIPYYCWANREKSEMSVMINPI